MVATESSPTNINTRPLATSLKQVEALMEVIGSINAAMVLYMKISTVILIAGATQIKNSAIRPTIPIPFFNMAEKPTTASTASDRNFPIIGTKLSTAIWQSLW